MSIAGMIGSTPSIRVDQTKFKQVLLNLLVQRRQIHPTGRPRHVNCSARGQAGIW